MVVICAMRAHAPNSTQYTNTTRSSSAYMICSNWNEDYEGTFIGLKRCLISTCQSQIELRLTLQLPHFVCSIFHTCSSSISVRLRSFIIMKNICQSHLVDLFHKSSNQIPHNVAVNTQVRSVEISIWFYSIFKSRFIGNYYLTQRSISVLCICFENTKIHRWFDLSWLLWNICCGLFVQLLKMNFHSTVFSFFFC